VANVLEGIRVLDFGRYIAGPYCAALLADLGAEVIRVEKVDGSEDRFVGPVGSDGVGALFLQANRNKLGLTLNPTKPRGREVVRRLVATADVVVANLPPPVLAAMGLDYESLCAIKPEIILTSVSAFGRGGPYSNRVGFDGIGQVMSGSVYLSGPPDVPTRAYVPWVDFGTASLAAFGTLGALLSRRETGCGQHVQGSLLGTALSFSNSNLIEQAVTGANRVASGNRGQIAGPSDIFRTCDGWVLVSVVGRPLFERWARLMGEDHWLSDPRFADDNSRGVHGEILSERMGKWCAERTTEAALAELERARIPAGPVYSPQQALDDPHIRAMGFLQPMDYPGVDVPAPVADTPVKLGGAPGIRHRAPQLGEHTDRILAELGYGDEEIAELHSSRVV
jgi:crotonobetainyl-CoA:carnitine CoA-transferase CaiB-like acyl-CoA transferase